mmetsp:Transcript_9352/g.21097  ORF Transcript_9352/g.21097 Transcript_9352/m.21097 type:complete len:163 (-) Transcript_9352:394-882(-)
MRAPIHRQSTHKLSQVMNMRGRKSRIQQAPMMSAEYPPRSILIKGQHEPSTRELQLQSRPSQPIPIKKRRPSSQELEDEATSADSASQYDWATWRMYTRITDARRLRAVSKRSCSIMTQDYHASQEHAHLPAEPIMSHIRLDMQPSTVEEDGNDGVFVFDAM